MHSPNLFSFATSELTQDAFLAYLIAWADPGQAEHDPAMHQAGMAFLRLLMDQHGLHLSTPTAVKVEVQRLNIDVLAYVTFSDAPPVLFVIEDKVHAGSYNELDKYLANGKKLYPDPEVVVRGIYLRTGNQADYSAIEAEKFRVIDRRTLLVYLQDEATGNPPDTIFQNYKAYLEAYQQRLDAYQDKPVQEWDGDAWVGFFSQQLLPNRDLLFKDYGYVANRSGGFQGAWWLPDDCPRFRGYIVYLQIDGSIAAKAPSRIAIKLKTVNKKMADAQGIDRTGLVRELADMIAAHPEAPALNSSRPKRLSPGRWMTAAEVRLNRGSPCGTADELLQLLRKLQHFVLRLGV